MKVKDNMNSKNKFLPLLVYILVSISLAIFLLSARAGIYYNVFFFWLFIVYLLSYNLYLIYTGSSRNNISSIIFFQIIVFLIIIRIPYRTSFGLYGVDSPTEYYVTMHILHYGWKPSDYLLASSYYNQLNYPFLYLINIIFSEISGKSILFVENWFPIVLSLATPFFVYLSSYKLFNSKRSALLTLFSFSTLYGYMIFHSFTIRESIGFIFFSQIIYLIITLDKKLATNKLKYSILLLLFTFALILSHHLTSFMLLLFMVICTCTIYILKITNIKLSTNSVNNDYLIKSQLPILIFVLFVAYWIYAYYRTPSTSPFTMLVNTFVQVTTLEASGHSVDIVSSFPNTIRYYVLLHGAVFFGIAFACFSGLTLFFRRRTLSIYEVSFFITASVPGFFGFLTILKIFGLSINAERFMLFTYFYLLILSGYSASKLLSHKSLKYIVLSIFLLFSLFNVYTIHPYLYTQNEPDYTHGEIRSYIYYTEYIPFEWFDAHSANNLLVHQETLRLLSPFIKGMKLTPFRGSIESNIKLDGNKTYITIPKKSSSYLSNEDLQYINKNSSKIYTNNDSVIIVI